MITILTGTNDFMLTRELKVLSESFVAENGDLALERIDGESIDLNRAKEAITSLPFLSSKKMVILRSASSNKTIAEHIEDLLKTVEDTTDLVLVEKKLDKRSVYYKTLKKQPGFKEFNDADDLTLAKWLQATAKEQGGVLSSTGARYLVDKLGLNQQLLSSELEKLLLYNPTVSRQSIDLLVESSPRSTVFELLDAAFSGNSNKALKIYAEQRRLKVDPQAMLALISWQLHALALIKVAGTRNPSEIAREGGVSPYVINKSISTAKHLTTQGLRDLIHDTLRLDIRLKSEPIDADSALQNLLLSISQS